MGLLARPAVASKLGEVWVHHTDIGDESCVDLGSLLRAASSLNELHVSDSEVALRRCSCTAPKGCSCTSPTWR